MSQENVEVIGAAYEAFAGRGVDGFLEYLTEDVDHRAMEGAPDDRGPMHGKEALRATCRTGLTHSMGSRPGPSN
jgi:ketosteroid isomerase-like protein